MSNTQHPRQHRRGHLGTADERQSGAVHWPALVAAIAVTLLTVLLVWAFTEWALPWLMALSEAATLHIRLAFSAAWTAAGLLLLWRWWRRRRSRNSAEKSGAGS